MTYKFVYKIDGSERTFTTHGVYKDKDEFLNLCGDFDYGIEIVETIPVDGEGEAQQ